MCYPDTPCWPMKVFTSSLSNPFQGIPEVHQALQTNINGSTVGDVVTTNFFKLGGFKFRPISKLRVKIRSASQKIGVKVKHLWNHRSPLFQMNFTIKAVDHQKSPSSDLLQVVKQLTKDKAVNLGFTNWQFPWAEFQPWCSELFLCVGMAFFNFSNTACDKCPTQIHLKYHQQSWTMLLFTLMSNQDFVETHLLRADILKRQKQKNNGDDQNERDMIYRYTFVQK